MAQWRVDDLPPRSGVFIGTQVAGQWEGLVTQFRVGTDEILRWLETGPLHLTTDAITEYVNAVRQPDFTSYRLA